jgi:hypothetical protein
MKIGFTGTQAGMSPYQQGKVTEYLQQYANVQNEFHHGDCVGSDAEAAAIAALLGYIIHIHPPINTRRRAWTTGNFIHTPKPYLERNSVIVEHSDVLLATPSTVDEVLRSGTWSTIRYARAKNIPITIFCPEAPRES